MQQSERLVKPIESSEKKTSNNSFAVALVYVLLVILGIGTGYLLTNNSNALLSDPSKQSTSVEPTKDAKKTTDPSCPNGMLESGGIQNEGTHKLIRDGGPSQTAYLTSSVVDLDEYIGKKVRVCGATMAAKKAPWLMDVESIDIL